MSPEGTTWKNTPSFQDLKILIIIPVVKTTGYTTVPLRGNFHVISVEGTEVILFPRTDIKSFDLS